MQGYGINLIICQDGETAWLSEQKMSPFTCVELPLCNDKRTFMRMSSHQESSASNNDTYYIQSIPGSHPTKIGVIFLSV